MLTWDLNLPSPSHSLDRIDNEGHYGPWNTRWATRLEQANNKRNNRILTAFGRTQTLAMWARELGISSGALLMRLKRGATLEECAAMPKGKARQIPKLRISRGRMPEYARLEELRMRGERTREGIQASTSPRYHHNR